MVWVSLNNFMNEYCFKKTKTIYFGTILIGYPSLPTMTVSEFYDERVRAGVFPDPNAQRDTSLQRTLGDTAHLEEEQDIERELKLNDDDDYELARMRAKDDYKDDHRRGEGNRYNRS